MNAAATSKAIGTGKNVPASATNTIPMNVTCAGISCAGINSATSAPSSAARIMKGIVVTASLSRFFAYCRSVPETGSNHPLDGTSHAATGSNCSERVSQGIREIKTSGAATRTSATPGGKSANSIVSTTTFSVGELIIVASAVVALAPPSYMLCPIGATQLAHSPNGTPVTAPIAVFTAAL
jgi:hypothetical protein